MDCLFCDFFQNRKDKIVKENELAFAIRDGFPVNPGHTLIIPKRHIETFFELTGEEIQDMHKLALEVKKDLDRELKPDGYNIGFNCGEYGGQTVMHCHMHVIPRFKGDRENPRGGVRNIIKGQSNY